MPKSIKNDSFVTTDSSLVDEPAKRIHACVKGRCDRGRRKECKYGYPKYPLPESFVGFPLHEGEQLTARVKRDLHRRIRDALKDELSLQQSPDEFYDSLGITVDTVHPLLSSVLMYPRFFPKRQPKDAWHGQVNPLLANLMSSNFDIQPVLSGNPTVYHVTFTFTFPLRNSNDLLCGEVRLQG